MTTGKGNFPFSSRWMCGRTRDTLREQIFYGNTDQSVQTIMTDWFFETGGGIFSKELVDSISITELRVLRALKSFNESVEILSSLANLLDLSISDEILLSEGSSRIWDCKREINETLDTGLSIKRSHKKYITSKISLITELTGDNPDKTMSLSVETNPN